MSVIKYRDSVNDPWQELTVIVGPQGPAGVDGADGTNGTNGTDGVGIASVVMNNDYTLTITLTNNQSYTTSSIRGPQGETGATGATGAAFTYADFTAAQLEALTGPQGPAGQDGADGQDGANGQDGADGVGIASIVLNNDYTLTITYTDGNSTTTGSIRGPQGETGATGATGPQGPTGPAGAYTAGTGISITNGVIALDLTNANGVSY